MRAIVVFSLLYIFAFADFSLTYKLDNTTLQTVNYLDKNHVLFTIYNNDTPIEKLLILNSKKYIIFNDENIEHIYEISDELSEPVKDTNISTKVDYKFIKKIKDTKIAGIPAQKWLVENSEHNKTEVIVSNNQDIVSALFKVMNALKEILPANKQEQAHIFNMGDGFVLLATGDLKLISYNQDKISDNIFTLEPALSDAEQEKLSDNIEKCFSDVCCGKESSDAVELNSFLKENIEHWHLEKIAKCEDPTEKNIESALYSNKNRHIIVEMTTGKEITSGKIESLKQQGIKVENMQKKNLNGFESVSAYLPVVNATVTDIMLPNTTISIYSKGKSDLFSFAKKAIKLNLRTTSYRSTNI